MTISQSLRKVLCGCMGRLILCLKSLLSFSCIAFMARSISSGSTSTESLRRLKWATMALCWLDFSLLVSFACFCCLLIISFRGSCLLGFSFILFSSVYFVIRRERDSQWFVLFLPSESAETSESLSLVITACILSANSSKETTPSPFVSTSLTIASNSSFVMLVLNRVSITCFSSVAVTEPSPSVSNSLNASLISFLSFSLMDLDCPPLGLFGVRPSTFKLSIVVSMFRREEIS
mmetsp:Transcript_23435/g.48788  ORF Transcript_23435/g.48788 Transcript_23435/m.48788 type:complete len:234 (-) Transcript_23435:268-969(-)